MSWIQSEWVVPLAAVLTVLFTGTTLVVRIIGPEVVRRGIKTLWWNITHPISRIVSAIVTSSVGWGRGKCWRIYLRFCSRGRQYERQLILEHIKTMVLDAQAQQYHSWIVNENGVVDNESNNSPEGINALQRVMLIGVGRAEMLQDMLSYLRPDTYPPEAWDNNNNVTRLDGHLLFTDVRSESTVVHWRWKTLDTDPSWKYLERVEKKWGHSHKMYFRG